MNEARGAFAPDCFGSENPLASKDQLREFIRQRRRTLDSHWMVAASALAGQRLAQLPEIRAARSVYSSAWPPNTNANILAICPG